jgi:prevent-host-death family protein
MTQIIPITEVRKNIFTLVEKVARTGEEIEVEKEGRRMVKLVPIKEDSAAKAKYAIRYILPKLAGIWKGASDKELKEVQDFIRGKKEKSYWKRKKFR